MPTARRVSGSGNRVCQARSRAATHAACAAYDAVAGRLVTIDGSTAEQAAHAAWVAARERAWQTLFPDPLTRLAVGTGENRLDALVRFFHARMNPGRG